MSHSGDKRGGTDKTLYFRVTGRVQGVFFRASTKAMADRHGLKGWVRNLKNGDVEGKVSGSPIRIESFTDWLKQGPEMARVLGLELDEHEFEDFTGFEIR